MMLNTQTTDQKRFLIKRSNLSTLKLFAEFYLPKYQALLKQLREGPYSVQYLHKLSVRMFDGPFGSDRKVDMYQDSGIPYIRVKDVLPDGIAEDELVYIPQEKHQDLWRSRVVPGNVLITIAGRLGTTAVFPEALKEGNITGHVVGIEPRPDINPHYLATFLNSSFGAFQVTRWGHRTTRPELNLFEVGQIEIPVPPPSIQDRIAQVMQEAYTVRRQKLAEAERVYQELNTLVLRKLGFDLTNIEGRRIALKSVRSIKGGRFDFEAVVTLQDIVHNYGALTPLRDIVSQIDERVTPASEYTNEDINYIGLGNIVSNTGELEAFSPVLGSTVLSASPLFRQGDILYGRMRPYLNKAWLAEFDGVCSGEAIVLRPNKKRVIPAFLHALLLSKLTLDQVVPLQSGSSLPRVAASDILNVKLPIPDDLDIQVEIGEEIARQREAVKRIHIEAASHVVDAKSRVERMILGQEEVM